MKPVKELPSVDRPREKLIHKGPEAMSDIELVALLLGSGTKKSTVLDLAVKVVEKVDDCATAPDLETLISIDGIGIARACQLVAAFEFTRRKLRKKTLTIRCASDVYPLVAHLSSKKQEHFLCISLSGANEVIASRTITIGLLNSSQVHPREVFADAISDRAASVILAHNHPSRQPEPSPEDLAVTRRLCEAGIILGITVLDHIIVAGDTVYSFRDNNLIETLN